MGDVARRQPRGTLTYRALWSTPDDGNRYEIIDGEVYVSPAPVVAHQRIVRNLARILDQHASRHALGEVLWAPLGVVLEKPTVVQPDIIFIAQERLSIIQEKALFGAPDLVVEVLSPSTASRDHVLKRDTYARTGVRHYWMLDPRKNTLQAFRLADERYVVEVELSGRRTFRPTLFPGLAIRLGQIWA